MKRKEREQLSGHVRTTTGGVKAKSVKVEMLGRVFFILSLQALTAIDLGEASTCQYLCSRSQFYQAGLSHFNALFIPRAEHGMGISADILMRIPESLVLIGGLKDVPWKATFWNSREFFSPGF